MAVKDSGYLRAEWRLHAKASSQWSNEQSVFGFRCRYDPVIGGQPWPSDGGLLYVGVDADAGQEIDTTFQVLWDHSSPTTGPAAAGHPTRTNMRGLADDMLTCWTALKTYIPSTYELREIRITCLDTTNHSVGGSNRFLLRTPSAGTSTNVWVPQQAMAISLRSENPGRKGHGRIYLGPMSQTVMGTDGLIGSTSRTNILNALGTLFETTRNGSGLIPAVIQNAAQTYWDTVLLEAGDEMDTQRRRRNQRPENYAERLLS